MPSCNMKSIQNNHIIIWMSDLNCVTCYIKWQKIEWGCISQTGTLEWDSTVTYSLCCMFRSMARSKLRTRVRLHQLMLLPRCQFPLDCRTPSTSPLRRIPTRCPAHNTFTEHQHHCNKTGYMVHGYHVQRLTHAFLKSPIWFTSCTIYVRFPSS